MTHRQYMKQTTNGMKKKQWTFIYKAQVKTPKNTWIQQQSFEENYFYIYQTIGEDWRIVHDTCNSTQTEILSTFYRAMICKRGLCCHAVSVCPPSVTFVDHVKTNKHIFEIVSPSGSDTILVFPYQRGGRYSDGNPPNGGFECKGIW